MMNKPAAKEPSMDEILSSIRQIIADDSGPPSRPAALSQAAPAAEPEPEPDDDMMSDFDGENAPLALSASQIVGESGAAPPRPVDFRALMQEVPSQAVAEDDEGEPEFVDPEDISFAPDPEAATPLGDPEPLPEQRPVAEPVERTRPLAPPPRPTAAQAAPMPDADLSRDIAEQLLEPASGAAVRANFAKLNNLGLGNSGLTIEAMMREMLRPMLKEWLDEHLPTVVERMVEREISRISRGVE
jgi:uncharacterized protein